MVHAGGRVLRMASVPSAGSKPQFVADGGHGIDAERHEVGERHGDALAKGDVVPVDVPSEILPQRQAWQPSARQACYAARRVFFFRLLIRRLRASASLEFPAALAASRFSRSSPIFFLMARTSAAFFLAP